MHQLAGPTDPIADVHWDKAHTHNRKGFFTDTSICIGCKACEVACKEWNRVPQDGDLQILDSSYDNTGALGANTWRHVAFIEQGKERIDQARESGAALVSLGMPQVGPPETTSAPAGGCGGSCGCASGTDASSGSSGCGSCGTGQMTEADALSATDAAISGQTDLDVTPPDTPEFRWLMSSDVCKHCTHAGCLDVCPTGALFRTEFGTVVVQADVCNGCGTCVAGCPFGVIERRDDGTITPPDGAAQKPHVEQEIPNPRTANKCTLCYDRLLEGETPACAKTCPTTSIKFGNHDDMVSKAHARVKQLHAQGMTEARLYGANDNDGVGGTGSVFLILDEPEVYGLPPDPHVPTRDLPQMYKTAGIAALGMLAAGAMAFLGGRR